MGYPGNLSDFHHGFGAMGCAMDSRISDLPVTISELGEFDVGLYNR
jgi:hypothetical protein